MTFPQQMLPQFPQQMPSVSPFAKWEWCRQLQRGAFETICSRPPSHLADQKTDPEERRRGLAKGRAGSRILQPGALIASLVEGDDRLGSGQSRGEVTGRAGQ